MAIRIQLRRDTASNWTGANPTLLAGEVGFETDTLKFKVGNGSAWADTDYANVTPAGLGNSLGDYIPTSDRGAAGGVAGLDSSSNLLVPGSSLVIEGATDNAYETTVVATDPTADRTITFPDATGTVVLSDGSGNVTLAGNLTVNGTTTTVNSTEVNIQNAFVFEGATADGFETTLTVVDPTADRTITFKDASGTVAFVSDVNAAITTAGIDAQSKANDAVTTAAAYTSGEISSLHTTLTGEISTHNSDTTNVHGIANTANLATQSDVDSAVSTHNADTTSVHGISDTTQLATQTYVSDSMTTHATLTTNVHGITDTANLVYTNDSRLTNTRTPTDNTVSEAKIVDGAVTSAKIADGTIVNGDISSSAAIAQSKISGLTSDLALKAPLASPALTGDATAVNLTISGDLIVNGTTTTVSSTNLEVTDPLIYIGTGNSANSKDLGIVGHFDNGTYQHTGIVRDATDGKWKLFSGISTEPSDTIDFTTWTKDTLVIGALEATSATIGNVSNTELQYLDGVTSAIQTQIDSKLATSTAASTYAPLADPTFTGTVTLPSGTVTSTMIADGTIVNADINSSAAIAQSKISGLTSDLSAKAPLADPTFTGTVTVSSSGVAFTDGTQTKAGIPSLTPFISKTTSYALSNLNERDSMIEVDSSSATTITIPTNANVAFPIGTSIDICQISTGQVTIAGDTGVTVNATPGLKLRAQWSTVTLLKRGTNTWIVYGDLTA